MAGLPAVADALPLWESENSPLSQSQVSAWRAQQYVAGSTGRTALRHLAAAEALAGLIGRCLALADVQGAPDFCTPRWRAMVGRELVLEGNSAFRLRAARDAVLAAEPMVQDFTIYSGGRHEPETWTYEYAVALPNSGQKRRRVNAMDVIHVRVNAEPRTWWRGRSPLGDGSSATLGVAALAEVALAGETSLPTFGVLSAADEAQVSKEALAAGGGAFGVLRRGPEELQTPSSILRLKPEPSQGLLDARRDAVASMAAACGIPPILVAENERSDGSSAREAWRRFAHAGLPFYAGAISEELRDKLGVDLAWDFSALAAADVQGRARAFGSMVAGGMSVEDAAHNAGVEL